MVFMTMSGLSGQRHNIVPNSSFEEFSGVPLGWFYNGGQFTRLVKYWSSPTLASPDAFGPGIVVPKHWQKKGFGAIKPFDGSAMVGITVFGCADGKPHCREYLHIQLSEPLVKGQKYELSYYVSHLEGSLYIDRLGAVFTHQDISQSDDQVITAKPQIYSSDIVRPIKGQWAQIKHTFVADEAYDYITLGNFFSDEQCSVLRDEAKYEFSYYYIDKVSLYKQPPFIEEEIPEDDITLQSLEVGKKIQLKNIYFDLDKSDLLPRSYVELNKLRQILKEHPNMRIEVHGHTDIQGESDYNEELSLQRSKSVTKYLINNGVSSDRIDFKGYGSNMPIANNADEKGRQLNRRVEILITAL